MDGLPLLQAHQTTISTPTRHQHANPPSESTSGNAPSVMSSCNEPNEQLRCGSMQWQVTWTLPLSPRTHLTVAHLYSTLRPHPLAASRADTLHHLPWLCSQWCCLPSADHCHCFRLLPKPLQSNSSSHLHCTQPTDCTHDCCYELLFNVNTECDVCERALRMVVQMAQMMVAQMIDDGCADGSEDGCADGSEDGCVDGTTPALASAQSRIRQTCAAVSEPRDTCPLTGSYTLTHTHTCSV